MDTTGKPVEVATIPLINVGPLPSQFPAAAVSSLYNPKLNQTFTATGGLGTLYFSKVGSLPSGMTLSSAGVLSGTPTATGSFSFTVYATDSAGDNGSQTYTLTVTPAITIGPNQTGSVARAIITSGGSGYTSAPTVIFSGPPSGGTLATGTAIISNGQVTGVTITSDGNGYTLVPTVSFSGGGGSGAAAAVPYALAAGTTGQMYAQQSFNQISGSGTKPVTSSTEYLTAQGGAGGYTYALTNGTLPNGLTLNLANGLISGTPSQAGLYSFKVTATDSAGNTGSQNFSIFVGQLSVSGSDSASKPFASKYILPSGTAGNAYDNTGITFQATGANSYSFPNSQLTFNGLTLDKTTGLLSGTPSRAGIYNVTVIATDTNTNQTGEANYLLTIKLLVTPDKLKDGTVGSMYSKRTFSAKGGNTSDTYTFSALNLPPGLTLTNGILSGTPTVTGNFTFDVTATDNNNPALTGERKFTVSITGTTLNSSLPVPPSPYIATGLPAATVGVPYSASVTASGGNVYKYTASYTTAGMAPVTGLPPGLQPDSTTGAIFGTPSQSGTFYVQVNATSSGQTPGGAIYPLVISPGLTLQPGSLPPASLNEPYHLDFTALGGSGNYTFSALTAPAGLTMLPTGELVGSPTSDRLPATDRQGPGQR